MSRVFIAYDDGHFNLKSANEFGKIITVFKDEPFTDEMDDLLPQVHRRARKVLEDFDPDTDYLCPIGPTLSASICIFILSRKFPRFKTLRWDRFDRAYYVVEMSEDLLEVA